MYGSTHHVKNKEFFNELERCLEAMSEKKRNSVNIFNKQTYNLMLNQVTIKVIKVSLGFSSKILLYRPHIHLRILNKTTIEMKINESHPTEEFKLNLYINKIEIGDEKIKIQEDDFIINIDFST